MKKSIFPLLVFLLSAPAIAQKFDVDLQIRPRYEYRHGFKTFLLENQEPAHFVSQRSRVNFNCKDEKIGIKLSLQNVRVWGEVPTTAIFDQNGVMVFEAFGEYYINKNLKTRLGRQVLSYDNQRILGGLDWAQQGQSHDAAVVSWSPTEYQRLDIAAAYNSDAEYLVQSLYTVNTYKNMQMAWYHIDFSSTGVSFLALNTSYEFPEAEEQFNINYIQTFGSFFNFKKSSFYADAAVYGQTGKKLDRDLSAWYAGANLGYKLDGNWNIVVGTEYLSGTDTNETADLHSFTPLFGTNHAFNGLMDYFYVGNHQNSFGLLDTYGKASFSKGKFQLTAAPHLFFSAADIYNFQNEKKNNYMGAEIDLFASYKIQKDFNINFGYSQFFATETLEFLKGAEANRAQNWAWLMVSFQPRVFSYGKKPQIDDAQLKI